MQYTFPLVNLNAVYTTTPDPDLTAGLRDLRPPTFPHFFFIVPDVLKQRVHVVIHC